MRQLQIEPQAIETAEGVGATGVGDVCRSQRRGKPEEFAPIHEIRGNKHGRGHAVTRDLQQASRSARRDQGADFRRADDAQRGGWSGGAAGRVGHGDRVVTRSVGGELTEEEDAISRSRQGDAVEIPLIAQGRGVGGLHGERDGVSRAADLTCRIGQELRQLSACGRQGEVKAQVAMVIGFRPGLKANRALGGGEDTFAQKQFVRSQSARAAQELEGDQGIGGLVEKTAGNSLYCVDPSRFHRFLVGKLILMKGGIYHAVLAGSASN